MKTNARDIHVPGELKRGALKPDEERYIDSGAHLLRRIPEWLGCGSLDDKNVLDVGCGTKLTQAILRDEIAVKSYTGIDVYQPMIEHLSTTVADPRFHFYHMDTHNEMYNTRGQPLTPDTRLPCAEQSFDIICLFSVFTHMAPHDYRAMLQALRPYVKPNGQLIYSLYLDELTSGGHGLINSIVAKHELKDWQPSGEPFRDAFPGKPLQWALYSREHALELIETTGCWAVDSINDPEEHIQHFIVGTPR